MMVTITTELSSCLGSLPKIWHALPCVEEKNVKQKSLKRHKTLYCKVHHSSLQTVLVNIADNIPSIFFLFSCICLFVCLFVCLFDVFVLQASYILFILLLFQLCSCGYCLFVL